MIGPFRRFMHRTAHRYHDSFVGQVYIHVHEAVDALLHATAYFVVLAFIFSGTAHWIMVSGEQFTALYNAGIIHKLAHFWTLSWPEFFAVTSAAASPFVAYRVWHARPNWHNWVHHGHHADRHLEALGDDAARPKAHKV